jgi:hypothetical protein
MCQIQIWTTNCILVIESPGDDRNDVVFVQDGDEILVIDAGELAG